VGQITRFFHNPVAAITAASVVKALDDLSENPQVEQQAPGRVTNQSLGADRFASICTDRCVRPVFLAVSDVNEKFSLTSFSSAPSAVAAADG